jgi:hypothetical protein
MIERAPARPDPARRLAISFWHNAVGRLPGYVQQAASRFVFRSKDGGGNLLVAGRATSAGQKGGTYDSGRLLRMTA